VWSHPVEIHPEETGGQLYTKLKFQAALSLNDFLYILQNEDLKPTKQDEANISFAPTLKREDGYLDFKNQTYQQIKSRVQALFPWPGTYCSLNSKRLKIYEIHKSDKVLEPGEVYTKGNQLILGTKDFSVRLACIQLEGKKRCMDYELLNGFKDEFTINKQG
jgi:methionyl-tRNA formyltransferase